MDASIQIIKKMLYALSIFHRAFITTTIVSTLFTVIAVYLEPVISNAASATDSVILTLNVVSGITITSPADTPMSTSLGVSTNTAIATTTWNVKTNNSLGYALVVTSSTFPAMKVNATQYVNDFPSTSTPALWSTLGTGGWFGYSGFGTDVNTGTWGSATASSCGATSTPSTTLKYAGFSSTTANAIATRASTTTLSGIDTTVCYAVEQKSVYIDSGTYTATITATATTL